MKKKQILLIALGVVIIALIIGVVAYKYRNRRTYTLEIPQVENLKSISVIVNEKGKSYETSYTDIETMKQIVDTIAGVKRVTKEQSNYDYPVNAEEIKTIEFHVREQYYSTLYLYKRNNKYYIEESYNGLYRISEEEYKEFNQFALVLYENSDAR